MSTELDLLIPRRKLMLDYPGRPESMPVGYIIYLNKFDEEWYHEYTSEEPIHIDESSTRYPEIFHPLPWWSDRKMEEMPEFVKYFDEAGNLEYVLKVERYKSHRDIGLFWAFEYLWENEPDIKRMSLTGWLPATEQDYNDYINSKNKSQ